MIKTKAPSQEQTWPVAWRLGGWHCNSRAGDLPPPPLALYVGGVCMFSPGLCVRFTSIAARLFPCLTHYASIRFRFTISCQISSYARWMDGELCWDSTVQSPSPSHNPWMDCVAASLGVSMQSSGEPLDSKPSQCFVSMLFGSSGGRTFCGHGGVWPPPSRLAVWASDFALAGHRLAFSSSGTCKG